MLTQFIYKREIKMVLNDNNKMIVTNKVEITVIIYKVNWVIIEFPSDVKSWTKFNFLSKSKSSQRHGISKNKRYHISYMEVRNMDIYIYNSTNTSVKSGHFKKIFRFISAY